MEQTVRARRPVGVTILGGLVLVAALVMALAGLAGMFVAFADLIPGVNIPGVATFLWGLTFFVLAICLGVAGAGLLSLRPWAWWLAMIVTLGALLYAGYNIYDASTGTGAGIELTSLLTVGFVGVVFAYLLAVYGRFRRPATM